MMTRIVANNRPKQPRRKRRVITLGVPAIVKLPRRGERKVEPIEPDPEADARVAAWFARTITPSNDD
jgi:hypothetical protein